MVFVRDIYYYKDYYLNFFNSLNEDEKLKFNWTLQLIATINRVPEKYLKYINDTDGLYEIRVEVSSNIYRVFCFFDKGKIIVLINGFQKKTQKTPKKEIELADRIKKEYFYEKGK